MNQRQSELAAERERLLRRIELERTLLSLQSVPVARALDFKSRAGGLVDQAKDYATKNPLVVVGAVLGLLIVRPRGMLRLAQKGLVFWKTWRSLRGFLPASLLGRFVGSRAPRSSLY